LTSWGGPLTFELQNGPVILRGTRRIFAFHRSWLTELGDGLRVDDFR
jgi:hypothetical protein